MPTKKASKKSQKGTNKKSEQREEKRTATKSGGKDTATSSKGSKKATGKGAAGKGGARKSDSRGGKKSAPRGASKATKTSASVREMFDAPADQLIGNCIGFARAGVFVERAVIAVGGISPADFDIDKKFEQMGVFNEKQCTQVKERVLANVRAVPCTINDGDVSCSPSDKARALRDALQAYAGKPS